MSTMDPRIARAEQASRRHNSATARLVATVASVASLAVGAALTYGFIGMNDTFRLMHLNSVFADWDSRMSDTWTMVSFSIAMTVSFFVIPIQSRLARQVEGALGGLLQTVPWATLGALLASVPAWWLMTPPVTVGVRTDPTFGKNEPWSTFDWVAYWAPAGLPVVLILALMGGLIYRSHRRRRHHDLRDLEANGARAIGTVVEVSGGNTEVMGAPLITMLVRFTDRSGVERFVTKRRPIPHGQVPVINQQILVMYDAADPGNTKRIAFGLGDQTSVHEAARQSH